MCSTLDRDIGINVGNRKQPHFGCRRWLHGLPRDAGSTIHIPAPLSFGRGDVRPDIRARYTNLVLGGCTDVRVDTPAIADGRAYVVSNGALAAYPTSCLDVTCVPTWTWQAPDGGPLSPPAIVGGDVLVQSAGGRFFAFSRACANVCDPVWSSRASYDPYAWVSSSDGVAVVGFLHANLVAFSLSCVGERSCAPSFTGADLGPGVRMANSFVTAGDTLYLVQGGPESAVNGSPAYRGGGSLSAVSLSCAGDRRCM